MYRRPLPPDNEGMETIEEENAVGLAALLLLDMGRDEDIEDVILLSNGVRGGAASAAAPASGCRSGGLGDRCCSSRCSTEPAQSRCKRLLQVG